MNLRYSVADTSLSEQLFNLEIQSFPNEYWSLESIKSEISKDNCICIVAYYNDKIVGYLFSSFVYDESELNRIAVLNEFRNRKIGNSLIKYLIDILHNHSCKTLFLEVRESNKSAIKLYKNIGFKKNGIRNNYYKKPTENAVLMSLKL